MTRTFVFVKCDTPNQIIIIVIIIIINIIPLLKKLVGNSNYDLDITGWMRPRFMIEKNCFNKS